MHDWIGNYIARQKTALDSIPADGISSLVGILREAWREDRQIFVFGNGGSAAYASHIDYAYDQVFAKQLANFGRAGDIVLAMSVSGSSPNLVKAFEWANEHKLKTIALVGAKRGKLADIANHAIVIDSDHYGRVEDAHMTICHLLAYAFMELPDITQEN